MEVKYQADMQFHYVSHCYYHLKVCMPVACDLRFAIKVLMVLAIALKNVM